MKIKIQIKHYLTGEVLFEFEKENNTIKDTVEEAVKRYANLRYADLSSANLSYANLRYADLSSANLRYSDLRYSDLRYANLSYANLRYADLSSANLSYADGLDYWFHIHHEILSEVLTEPIANRINYIKENKPPEEVELRLKLLRPVLGEIPTTEKGWKELHKKECGCSFTKTIFTKKNKTFKPKPFYGELDK